MPGVVHGLVLINVANTTLAGDRPIRGGSSLQEGAR